MGQTPSSRYRERKTRLVKAVKFNDLHTVQKVLSKRDMSINHVKDIRGSPLLCLAVRRGNVKVVTLLLKEGTPRKTETERKKGGWEVHLGVNKQQEMLTKILVSFGTEPLDSNNSGYDPKPMEDAPVDKDEGINLDVTDKKGLSPVHISAISGSTDIAKVLIDEGADVNKPDVLEASPLHAAAAYGHDEMCELLLRNGADANAVEKSGLAPLHLAIMTGGVAVARVLLQHGALANIPDNEGRSPAHFAAVLTAFRGLDDVVRTNRSLVLNLLLLSNGGDVRYLDDSKCSLLSYALIKENHRLVRMYMDWGMRLEKDDRVRMASKHPEATARYEQELDEEPDTKVPTLYRCCRRAIMTHLAASPDVLTDSKLYNAVTQLELPRIVENFLKYKS